MGFKIAFFDIDNTLYDWREERFIPSGIEALRRLEKEGVALVLCTARPYHSVKHFGIFDLGIHFDGFITSCGACAVYHNKTVYIQLMDPKITKKLCRTIVDHGLTAEVVTPRNRFLIAPPEDYLRMFHEGFTDVIPEVHSYRGGPSTGLLLHAPREFDELFTSMFPTLTYYRFHDFGVDVMPAPRNKGDAIMMILKYLGLTKKDAISFGDDTQDISMAKASYFVCMGNGKEEVKLAADEIAGDILEDGLAKVIAKHFGW